MRNLAYVFFKNIVFCMPALLLTSCGGDDVSDLSKYIQEVKARPKGMIDPLPETKVVESYVFKPDGLRDPFLPMDKNVEANTIDVGGTNGIRPDLERRKEELESYSLDTLRMVGTLTNKTGLWAMIRAKDGTIHRVKAGNHIGLNFGKIIRILEDKIEIMEIVPDNKPGSWREQQATLALVE
jgi:type IV pilus assembly protein PilP